MYLLQYKEDMAKKKKGEYGYENPAKGKPQPKFPDSGKADIVAKFCYLYSTGLYTKEAAAAECGVSYRSIFNWCIDNKEFADMCRESDIVALNAKARALGELAVERAFKEIQGTERKTIEKTYKVEIEVDEITGEKKETQTLVSIKETATTAPLPSALIIYTMKNTVEAFKEGDNPHQEDTINIIDSE